MENGDKHACNLHTLEVGRQEFKANLGCTVSSKSVAATQDPVFLTLTTINKKQANKQIKFKKERIKEAIPFWRQAFLWVFHYGMWKTEWSHGEWSRFWVKHQRDITGTSLYWCRRLRLKLRCSYIWRAGLSKDSRGRVDQSKGLLCFDSVCELLCVCSCFDFMSFLFCFVLLGERIFLSFKLFIF